MQYNNDDWSHWTAIIGKYNKPDKVKSWWQVINSFVPYLLLWVLMVYSLNYSYWITIALSILSAGFLVRIFIIFHDCGHGSFFRSAKLNKVLGIIAGGFVFTPFHKWHYQHRIHHQTVGNLDKRGVGDVMTWTMDEFRNKSFRQRLFYRLYRNPIVMLFMAPIILFTIVQHFPDKRLPNKINRYTHLTTLGLLIGISLVSFLIGLKAYVLIQVPVLFFATNAGVWLFFIQHQFKDVVWERDDNWDYVTMAMQGSSYLALPRLLQWFSGNIGFHHIHHLSLKIPNYNLEKCMRENPIFQKDPLTFFSSLKSVKYKLWDEEKHKMISFKEARRRR